jgi:hypothetical protein
MVATDYTHRIFFGEVSNETGMIFYWSSLIKQNKNTQTNKK